MSTNATKEREAIVQARQQQLAQRIATNKGIRASETSIEPGIKWVSRVDALARKN